MPKRKRVPGKIFEKVPTYAVPSGRLFNSVGDLKLHGVDLSVFLYCCRLASEQCSDGQFLFKIEPAVAATGYSERQIWRGLQLLQNTSAEEEPHSILSNERLIVKVKEERFLPNTYSICTADGLPISYVRGEEKTTLRGLLFKNKLGYDDIPCHIMNNLSALKGSPLAVLLTGIKLALDLQSAKFVADLQEWKQKAHIYKDDVLRSTWQCETVHDLMHVSHKKGRRVAQVELFDPIRHTTLANNEADAIDRAREKAMMSQWEAEKLKQFSQEELECWFVHEYPDAQFTDGEFYIDCPVCHGSRYGKRTPTLRVRFNIGKVGVMSCHAFRGKAKGNGEDVYCSFDTKGKVPYHLVAKRDGISPKAALTRMRDFILERRGLVVEEIEDTDGSSTLPNAPGVSALSNKPEEEEITP